MIPFYSVFEFIFIMNRKRTYELGRFFLHSYYLYSVDQCCLVRNGNLLSGSYWNCTSLTHYLPVFRLWSRFLRSPPLFHSCVWVCTTNMSVSVLICVCGSVLFEQSLYHWYNLTIPPYWRRKSSWYKTRPVNIQHSWQQASNFLSDTKAYFRIWHMLTITRQPPLSEACIQVYSSKWTHKTAQFVRIVWRNNSITNITTILNVPYKREIMHTAVLFDWKTILLWVNSTRLHKWQIHIIHVWCSKSMTVIICNVFSFFFV